MTISVISTDVSNGLRSVLDFLLTVFKFEFDFMRSIEFFGTNLLSFTINIFLLGIALPIIFTLVRSEAVFRQRKRGSEIRNKRRSEKSDGD